MKRSMPSTDLLKPFPSLLFLREPISSFTSPSYGPPAFLKFCSLRNLLKLPHSFGFATAALLGAGTLGALLLLRQVSPRSLSWIIQASRPDAFSSEPPQLSVPGLLNDGNNCFLNSILQALASSGALLSFVAAYGKDSALSMFQGVESNFPATPLAEALTALLQELSMLDTQIRVASPHHVMRALELYVKQFDLAAQQDAAEALVHLASALQEERSSFFENFLAFRPSLLDASRTIDDDGLSNGICMDKSSRMENCALHIWRQHSHWPMEGTMGSLLTCQECGFQFSTQFQSFNDVPLSPPLLADGNIVEGCTIEDCLEQFTAPESIPHVKCSRCSHASALHILDTKEETNKAVVGQIECCTFDDDCSCETLMAQECQVWKNSHVDAFKQLKFGRCPEVLCLHVQRAVLNTSGELRKWTGHVSFPFVLNLFPYTLSAQRHIKEKWASVLNSQMQLIGHRDELKKSLTQKEAFRLQSKELSYVNSVPLSTDESTSDDTNHSISSGSEDLASDSSFDSFSRRLGNEMLDNPEQDEHVHPEACADSLNRCDILSSEQFADRSIGFSEGEHSLPSPAADADNGRSTCKQVLPGLSDSSTTRKERIMGGSKPPGVALQSHENQDPVTVLDSCLHMAPSSNPFLHTFMATSTAPKYSLTSLPAFVNEDDLCKHKVSSKQVEDSHESGRWLYELISVVVHHGSPRSGHYTVYRKAKLPPKNLENLFSRTSMDADESHLVSGKKQCAQDCFTVLNPYMGNYDQKLEECSTLDTDSVGFELSKKKVMANERIRAQSISDVVTLQGYFETRHCHPTVHIDTPMANAEEFLHSASAISNIDMPMENTDNLSDDSSAREDTVLWFRVSDSDVDRVTEEEVLMAQATLLFYERCCKVADKNHTCR